MLIYNSYIYKNKTKDMIQLSNENITIGNTYSTDHYEKYNQSGDKNYFEEIIDKMILDQVVGMNESFKNAISNLSKDKKRMAILSLLDKDRNLFKSIKALVDKDINKMDHIKDVILMLRDYVKVGEVEKKKFGEVMTPLDLVKEMLNTLPLDVWSNPKLRWLDPANGTGPYPIMVIYKLMIGLKDWEPDEEKRYKHIIENMIYVAELQPKNMFLYLCAVDPFDTYKLNIYTGSFLEDGFNYHMKNIWGIEKFDIIIGNPPYQEHKEGNTKTKPIWNLFVLKSLEMIKSGGYLTMIHPGGWRSPSGVFRNVYEEFMGRNIIYLSLNDFKKGLEVFGVGTNFDYYTIQNTKNVGIKTKIKTSDDVDIDIELNNLNFIPNGDFSLYESLSAKDGEDKVEILHSYSAYETRKSYVSNEKSFEFNNPCVYTITQKDGINLFWSNTKDNGHFNTPKVIWSNGLGTYPIVDLDGQYALTQFSYAIEDTIENLENIKQALESDRFLKLMGYAKFTNNKYDHKVISTFKKDFWKFFI